MVMDNDKNNDNNISNNNKAGIINTNNRKTPIT